MVATVHAMAEGHIEARAGSGARLARLVLVVFLVTFIVSRLVVFLIMSRQIPDLYMHIGGAGGTHVHHLNYGIFLLSAVGAYLLFVQPDRLGLTIAAVLYAVGLALTFDEFGMWLHLGGSYWQRASFDAIVVIAALLGLIAAAPKINQLRARHWIVAAGLLALVGAFTVALIDSFNHAGRELAPRFEKLEAEQPP